VAKKKSSRFELLEKIVRDGSSSSELIEGSLRPILLGEGFYFDDLWVFDDIWVLLYFVAAHKNCPEFIMEIIIESDIKESYVLKARLAENGSASDSVMRRLFEKNEPYVWLSLLRNPKTPRDIVVKFIDSNDKDLCDLAKKHPSLRGLSNFF
jgi:hypothetical protein